MAPKTCLHCLAINKVPLMKCINCKNYLQYRQKCTICPRYFIKYSGSREPYCDRCRQWRHPEEIARLNKLEHRRKCLRSLLSVIQMRIAVIRLYYSFQKYVLTYPPIAKRIAERSYQSSLKGELVSLTDYIV